MRIAVIGSGISGLGCAYLLSPHVETHLYERDRRIGGHSHTVDVTTEDGVIPVDTGFIVYNGLNYPNLVGLFHDLGVKTEDTDMSFGISVDGGRLEYEGSLRGLLAQPSNLLKPSYWLMISDLVRFYRSAVSAVATGPEGESLGDFIAREGYGRPFVYDHLLPMAAAIWSCPADTMMAFPARSFIRFLDNHQLLNFIERPQWKTVSGGSRQYVKKITAALGDNLRVEANILGLERRGGGVVLSIEGEGEIYYDKVILAAHADQSLRLIRDASDDEKRVLGAFDFQPNRVVLHSDTRLMPKRKAAWASWSYLKSVAAETGETELCVTYWMNRLQNLKTRQPLLVTLNPTIEPDGDLIHGVYDYDHPVFDQKAIAAQIELPKLQGQNGLYFCGAWTGYGFHEDGLSSAVAVAKTLGVDIPWVSPTTAYSPLDAQEIDRKMA
jgi:predicted NAD/FAD-binding protein